MNISVFISHLIALLKRLVLILILFSVTRILFLLFSLTYFVPIDWNQFYKAFFFGFRFDFIVVYYLNILYILFHLFPFKITGTPGFQNFLKWLFVVVNSVLLMANFIDIEYFEFSKKRSGWDLIDMLISSKDTMSLIPHYIINYWHLFLMWAASIYLLIRFYPKLIIKNYRGFPKPLINKISIPLAAVVLLGAGFAYVRGLEAKPVRIISANNYVKPKYIPLLFNTPFVILNTINQHAEAVDDFFPLEELTNIYSPVKDFHQSGSMKPKNVFIIILESFGKNFTQAKSWDGRSFTPFFNTLSEEGLFCSNAYANVGNSINALPTIIGGFPSYLKTAFVSSAYSVNTIRGIGSILKDEGYITAFFHGGMNGTMGFDKFCQMAGIDMYYGRSEFNNEEYFDGAWGIYDEEFFQFTAEKVNSLEQPFFSVLFSLSSHEPYPIPKRYRNEFFPKENKILRSISYTDYSLCKFFETVKKMEWYENTLFVICPDHVSSHLKDESKFIQNRIPIVYYCSADTSLTGIYNNITQQLDIVPSILDYLGYPKSFVSFGESIFRDEYKFTVSKSGVNYQVIDSAFIMNFDGKKAIQVQSHFMDSLIDNNLIQHSEESYENLEILTKAYLQNYFYRLNKNLLADTLPLYP